MFYPTELGLFINVYNKFTVMVEKAPRISFSSDNGQAVLSFPRREKMPGEKGKERGGEKTNTCG